MKASAMKLDIVRYKETTEGTNISYQEFKDKVIELAVTSDNPYKKALHYFGLQKTKWHKAFEKTYQFTESILDELSKRYTLGIIANQSAGSTQRLADWGIGKYFDLVIASADEDVENRIRKYLKLLLSGQTVCPKML